MARGKSGTPYTWLGALAGVAYLLAVVVLRARGQAEVQLLGRVTYEGFAAAWPSQEGPFADKLNADPKVVVSTTLKEPARQNTTVIAGNVVEEIAALREETAGLILVAGSGTLVQTLLRADLVGELRLMV